MLLETSLWKLSTGFEPSLLADIGKWLTGWGPSRPSVVSFPISEPLCAVCAATPVPLIGAIDADLMREANAVVEVERRSVSEAAQLILDAVEP